VWHMQLVLCVLLAVRLVFFGKRRTVLAAAAGTVNLDLGCQSHLNLA
jgi:hypothetical protein